MSKLRSSTALSPAMFADQILDSKIRDTLQKQKVVSEEERLSYKRYPDKQSLAHKYKHMRLKHRHGNNGSSSRSTGRKSCQPSPEELKDDLASTLERLNLDFPENRSYVHGGPWSSLSPDDKNNVIDTPLQPGKGMSPSRFKSKLKEAFIAADSTEQLDESYPMDSSYYDETTQLEEPSSEMTTQEIIERYSVKPRKEEGNISAKYLRENKKMEIRKSQELHRLTLDEAKHMENKCITCINEANIFAEILQRSVRYRLLARSDEEERQWQHILESENLLEVDIPVGLGNRVGKMLIEAYDVLTGEQHLVLSTQYFFLEHSRLQTAVKKSRSTLPTPADIPYASDRPDVLEKSRGVYDKFSSPHSMNFHGTSNVAVTHNNNNSLGQRAETSAIIGLSASAPVAHPNSSPLATRHPNPGGSPPLNDKNVSQQQKEGAVKSDYQQFNEQIQDIEDQLNFETLPATSHQEREEVLAHLKDILDSTVTKAKAFEKQAIRIKRRGWNIQL